MCLGVDGTAPPGHPPPGHQLHAQPATRHGLLGEHELRDLGHLLSQRVLRIQRQLQCAGAEAPRGVLQRVAGGQQRVLQKPRGSDHGHGLRDEHPDQLSQVNSVDPIPCSAPPLVARLKAGAGHDQALNLHLRIHALLSQRPVPCDGQKVHDIQAEPQEHELGNVEAYRHTPTRPSARIADGIFVVPSWNRRVAVRLLHLARVLLRLALAFGAFPPRLCHPLTAAIAQAVAATAAVAAPNDPPIEARGRGAHGRGGRGPGPHRHARACGCAYPTPRSRQLRLLPLLQHQAPLLLFRLLGEPAQQPAAAPTTARRGGASKLPVEDLRAALAAPLRPPISRSPSCRLRCHSR
mmetsp:Transcript_176578/g.566158  ORF Transcript_176578/g.566158 Transcript_176578/m.566158 type:complete len:350 (+) Transcript_176578:661-1710(+)